MALMGHVPAAAGRFADDLEARNVDFGRFRYRQRWERPTRATSNLKMAKLESFDCFETPGFTPSPSLR